MFARKIRVDWLAETLANESIKSLKASVPQNWQSLSYELFSEVWAFPASGTRVRQYERPVPPYGERAVVSWNSRSWLKQLKAQAGFGN